MTLLASSLVALALAAGTGAAPSSPPPEPPPSPALAPEAPPPVLEPPPSSAQEPPSSGPEAPRPRADEPPTRDDAAPTAAEAAPPADAPPPPAADVPVPAPSDEPLAPSDEDEAAASSDEASPAPEDGEDAESAEPGAAPLAAPEPAPAATLPHRDSAFSILVGRSAVSLLGLGAGGWALRLGSDQLSPGRPSSTRVSVEAFLGETGAGLAMRSIAASAEAWAHASPRVRGGLGLDTGVIFVRRATTDAWAAVASAGLRAGLEVSAARFSSGELVVGAHGAARLERWISGLLSVGYRFGGARRAPHPVR